MDETAYKAMKNTMGRQMMENINAGDIWKRQGKEGQEYPAYVLKSWKDISLVVSLGTLQPSDKTVGTQVRAQEMMWADTRKINWCKNIQLTSYIRQVTDAEKGEIERKVAETLFGTENVKAEEDISLEDSEAYQELEKDNEYLKEKCKAAEQIEKDLREELEQTADALRMTEIQMDKEIENLRMELEGYKLREAEKEKAAADKKAVNEMEKINKRLKKENEIWKKKCFEMLSEKVEEMAK